MTNLTSQQTLAQDNASVVAAASRAWRRLGVRTQDADRLRRELVEDLDDAANGGVDARQLLGTNITLSARAIATEQDVHGLAARYLTVALACFFGGLVSWAPVMLLLAAEFSNGSGTAWDSPYLYYGGAGLLSYLLIPFSAEYALAAVGDRRARRTRTTLLKSLPLVAAVATAAGCITAGAQGFETRPAVFISTAATVSAVFVIGCLGTRTFVLHSSSPNESTGHWG